MTIIIECRSIRLINTDPQRRCYYGVHYSSKLVWGEWEKLVYTNAEEVEGDLAFWRELNADAVRYQGKSAKREFRVKELVA